jgi:NAD(P)H dehydrogenase (quinone)
MKQLFVTALLLAGLSQININAQVNVLVSYYSQTGKTKAMANAVAQGSQSVDGVKVLVKSMDETTPQDLQWAHAVIVGCPVHNANIPHQALAKLLAWPGKDVMNKLGAAFVTAGSISSGEEITQMNIIINLLMKGMVIVGGPDYSQPFGASAVTREEPFGSMQSEGVAPQFLKKAEALGKRVAEIAIRVKW